MSIPIYIKNVERDFRERGKGDRVGEGRGGGIREESGPVGIEKGRNIIGR